MAENLCVKNNCHACCVDSRLKLSLIEAATLRNLGTALMGLFHFDGKRNNPSGKKGMAVYDMSSSCGALNNNGLCNIYQYKERPDACDGLEAGSRDCLMIRAEQGLGDLRYE